MKSQVIREYRLGRQLLSRTEGKLFPKFVLLFSLTRSTFSIALQKHYKLLVSIILKKKSCFRYKPSFPNMSGTYFLPCKKIVSMVYDSKPIFVSIYWALLSDWHAQSLKILKSLSQTGNSSAKLKTSYPGPPGKANIKSWEISPQIIQEGPIKGIPKTMYVHVW